LQIAPVRVEVPAPAEPKPCRGKAGPGNRRQDGQAEQNFEPDKRRALNGEVALPIQFLFHPVHPANPVKIQVFDAHPVNSEESSLIQPNPGKSRIKNHLPFLRLRGSSGGHPPQPVIRVHSWFPPPVKTPMNRAKSNLIGADPGKCLTSVSSVPLWPKTRSRLWLN
jgi:hypothetical protein